MSTGVPHLMAPVEPVTQGKDRMVVSVHLVNRPDDQFTSVPFITFSSLFTSNYSPVRVFLTFFQAYTKRNQRPP